MLALLSALCLATLAAVPVQDDTPEPSTLSPEQLASAGQVVGLSFTAEELDECPLTLRDLHAIEESFIPVLMGTLHGRLEYPWQKDQKRDRSRADDSTALQPRPA